MLRPARRSSVSRSPVFPPDWRRVSCQPRWLADKPAVDPPLSPSLSPVTRPEAPLPAEPFVHLGRCRKQTQSCRWQQLRSADRGPSQTGRGLFKPVPRSSQAGAAASQPVPRASQPVRGPFTRFRVPHRCRGPVTRCPGQSPVPQAIPRPQASHPCRCQSPCAAASCRCADQSAVPQASQSLPSAGRGVTGPLMRHYRPCRLPRAEPSAPGAQVTPPGCRTRVFGIQSARISLSAPHQPGPLVDACLSGPARRLLAWLSPARQRRGPGAAHGFPKGDRRDRAASARRPGDLGPARWLASASHLRVSAPPWPLVSRPASR